MNISSTRTEQQIFDDLIALCGAPAPPQPPAQPDLPGAALREPIFYGGESAYGFQYRDFAELKYGADDAWLRTNKRFTIGEVRKVVAAAAVVQDRKMNLAARIPTRRLQLFARLWNDHAPSF
jgi:hypothetical protein